MIDFTSKRIAYEALKDIYLKGAYSSIELDRLLSSAPNSFRGYITALVYSTLELDIKSSYILMKLTNRKIKPGILILLKMGIAEILTSDRNTPLIVNEYVAFAKNRFPGTEGFINAVLRKANTVEISNADDPEALSVKYSIPVWIINRLISDYGLGDTLKILSVNPIKKTHIRPNTRITDIKTLTSILEKNGCGYIDSGYGLFVDRDALSLLDAHSYTAQSVSSILAVNLYSEKLDGELSCIDMCAAPGGKSVLLNEIRPSFNITACDVHPHRVNLIKSYAHRMRSNITFVQNDATKPNENYYDKYDLVICDVPCSGSGLLKSSPDILMFKNESILSEMTRIQYDILSVSSKYVKKGGRLCYSTCSLFKCENDDVIDKFLDNHSEFERAFPAVRILPDSDRDGFYIERLVRK